MQKKIYLKKLPNYIDSVLDSFGVKVSPQMHCQLEAYFKQLFIWNHSKNLSGIKEIDQMVFKHLGDTLLFLKYLPHREQTMLDIGTGAGVPGLITKILRPNLEVVLAEIVKKKCSFLQYVIALLGLKKIHVCNKKIEPSNPPILPDPNGFDIIVSQATGSLNWLIETCKPFLKKGGKIIALKGPSGLFEAQQLKREKAAPIVNIATDELPLINKKRVIITIRFHN